MAKIKRTEPLTGLAFSHRPSIQFDDAYCQQRERSCQVANADDGDTKEVPQPR